MLNKKIKRKLIAAIVPKVVYIILLILYCLTRHRFHINEYSKEHNFIGAFWHGEFLMLPFLYKHFQTKVSKERDKGFHIISSHHFDAELIAKVYNHFGLKSLRGSTSKGGLEVLIKSIKMLKEGYDIGISPDGPKGPYHSISDGIIAMSQKTGKHIVPIRVVCNRYWELKTWDKFRIPKPFAQVDYYMLDSFSIDKSMNIDEAKALVQKHLEKDV